jgi:hypothetical protein
MPRRKYITKEQKQLRNIIYKLKDSKRAATSIERYVELDMFMHYAIRKLNLLLPPDQPYRLKWGRR